MEKTIQSTCFLLCADNLQATGSNRMIGRVANTSGYEARDAVLLDFIDLRFATVNDRDVQIGVDIEIRDGRLHPRKEVHRGFISQL